MALIQVIYVIYEKLSNYFDIGSSHGGSSRVNDDRRLTRRFDAEPESGEDL